MVATPVLENGTISSIKVLQGGTGYSPGNVTASITYNGSGVKFNSIHQSWRINLFQKNFSSFTDDDGFIDDGLSDNTEIWATYDCKRISPKTGISSD